MRSANFVELEQAQLLRWIAFAGGGCNADQCQRDADALIEAGFAMLVGRKVALTDAGLKRRARLRPGCASSSLGVTGPTSTRSRPSDEGPKALPIAGTPKVPPSITAWNAEARARRAKSQPGHPDHVRLKGMQVG
jgi:hypothetical protein